MDRETVSLMDFSDCLLLNLLKYLDSSTLFYLSRVNCRLCTLIQDSSLWKKIDARTEPNSSEKIEYCLARAHKSTWLLCLRGVYASRTLLTRLKEDSFPNMTILAMENQIIDQSVTLNSFPKTLQELSFKHSSIANSSVFFKKTFERMENLKVLLLDGCLQISSSVVMSVSKYPCLEILSFYKCPIENSIPYFSIAGWHGFKNLKILDVRLSGLGNSFLKSMIRCENIMAIYFQNMDTTYVRDYKNKSSEMEAQGMQVPRVEFERRVLIGNDNLITNRGTSEFRKNTPKTERVNMPTSYLYTDPYGPCTCGSVERNKHNTLKESSRAEQDSGVKKTSRRRYPVMEVTGSSIHDLPTEGVKRKILTCQSETLPNKKFKTVIEKTSILKNPLCKSCSPNVHLSTSVATTSTSEATMSTSEATTPTSEATTSNSEAMTATSEAMTSTSEATTSTSKTIMSSSEATTSTSEATTSISEATTSTSEATTSNSEAIWSTSEATISTSEAMISTSEATISTSEANISTSKATTSTSEAKTSTSSRTDSTGDIVAQDSSRQKASVDKPSSSSKAHRANKKKWTSKRQNIYASCSVSNTETVECVDDAFENFPFKKRKREKAKEEEKTAAREKPSVEVAWRNEVSQSLSLLNAGKSREAHSVSPECDKYPQKVPGCSKFSRDDRNDDVKLPDHSCGYQSATGLSSGLSDPGSRSNNCSNIIDPGPSTSGLFERDGKKTDGADDKDKPSTSGGTSRYAEEDSDNKTKDETQERPNTPPRNPRLRNPQNFLLFRNRTDANNRSVLEISISGNRRNPSQHDVNVNVIRVGEEVPLVLNAVRMINFMLPPDQQNENGAQNPEVEIINLNMHLGKTYDSALKRLSLRGYVGVTDVTLLSIEHLNLELLDLTYTKVTREGIQAFFRVNPNCRVLHKKFCVCKPNLHF